MNNHKFNQDEELFLAFDEAKQAHNYLLAEQLAQKIYQKYPSLDNHYRIVELYFVQDFIQKAYEIALEEKECYERSAKYLTKYIQLAILNARRLLLQTIVLNKELLHVKKQLASAEELYTSIYGYKLQEKKKQWQDAFAHIRPIFDSEFRVLTSQLPLLTFQTFIKELLPSAKNPFLIAKTCEVIFQLELSMDLYLIDVFTEKEVRIASDELKAPNQQPFVKKCEQLWAQSLANKDVYLYEMLQNQLLQQLMLTYPFTPPIAAEDYIRLTIQLYQTGQISEKEELATIKQYQLIQEKYQQIIQKLL